jgi:sugar lactone lactonase YvrE
MRRTRLNVCLATSMLLAGAAVAGQPEKLWEVTGLKNPESAVLDPAVGVLYVTDIAGEPTGKDGVGFIAKLSPDGRLLDAEWVKGLDAPKGIVLSGGKLFVADIDRLVIVDVETATVEATLPAPGAQFLNDVTATEDGRVFVSDMVTDTIWVLDGGRLDVWLQDASLENPNGLLAEEGRLVLAAWGRMTDGFATEVPGHVKTIDLETRAVSSLGDPRPVGNLDGIEADGRGGYLATDWLAGGLFHIAADGTAELLLDLEQGSADLEFIEAERLAVIPMMLNGTVVAYRVD